MEESIHEGKKIVSKNGFDIIECANCGFTHALPIPSLEELERIYKNEYYDKEKPLYFQRMEEDRKWWEMTYHERYEKIEEKLGRKGIMLDIGSGPGLFLEVGKSRGWECVGLEPSKQAAEYSRAKGLHIVEDFLTEELSQKINNFDAIHMSEVLEHIRSPNIFIDIAKKMMSKKSVISITVPNDFNPFQIACIENKFAEPWWVAPPHHLNYFNVNTLSNFLKTMGFSCIETQVTFPIDIFLLMGDNYINNDQVGRSVHSKRVTFEHNLKRVGMNSVKQDLYKAFSKVGLGREVTSTAMLD